MTGIASGNTGTRRRVSLAEIEAAAAATNSNHSSTITMPSESKKSRGSDCIPIPRSNPVTLSEVLLALDESLEERDRRIHNLFQFFDISGKGFLDHSDIEKGFDGLDIPTQYKYAKDLLDVCDSNRDDRVDFKEFSGYMDSKELELYTIFRDIDVKHHGCIKREELGVALQNSGIHLNAKELNQFVEHIDKDNNGIISFREWRDFLLLYPHAATIANIYQYWEKLSLADMAGQEAGAAPQKGTGNGVGATQPHVQAAKYFLAGGVAGALSRTVTAPLDRLKVLLQVERDHHHSVQQRGRARILPCVLKMYREGGFMGFFRGNGINVIKVAPESAIKFYSYEMMKDVVVSVDGLGSKEDISGMGRLFAGGTAGAIAQTAIYPMDLLKTRLQTFTSVDGRAPPSAVKLSKDIWQQEGPRAFYRGLLPSLIGMIPYAGIDLAAYESLKNVSRQWLPEDHEPGPLIQVCCGMISGALGATCVYPLQLVRTRLQAQPMNSQNRYTGMIDVFRRTYREEGLLAFYKGLFPNLLKVIPAASITYMAYEEMKSQLGL